ncbi:MAG TPA: PA14 domain-containing protein [Verrucomicrobiae bacterium]
MKSLRQLSSRPTEAHSTRPAVTLGARAQARSAPERNRVGARHVPGRSGLFRLGALGLAATAPTSHVLRTGTVRAPGAARGCSLGALAALLLLATSGAAQPAPAIVSSHNFTVPGVDAGELLLGELNCVACHPADAAAKGRLNPRRGPVLDDPGLRITPQYLRAFLSDPHQEKPGTTMPDLLHAMNAGEKNETVDTLVHFLSSLQKTNSAPVGADPFKMEQGRGLYHQVGCVACHAPFDPPTTPGAMESPDDAPRRVSPKNLVSLQQSSVPLGNLAKKTTVDELTRFLMNPLKARPSGRMPSLNLTTNEATAIAMYLLREQAAASANRPALRLNGLNYQYWEASFESAARLDSKKVTASGSVDQFNVSPKKRVTNIGLRFTGVIQLPADGAYTFYTSSDDGSILYLGTQKVVDNDGIHSATEKKGTITLKAGEHPILVNYFNGGNEAVLKVSYEGPGLKKQEIPSSVLFRQGRPMIPLQEEKLTVDADKAARGKGLFASLGCAACHQAGIMTSTATRKKKPLFDLDSTSTSGCLADSVKPGLPRFNLSDTQRAALKATLAGRDKLKQPLSPKDLVTHTMAALNCYACHSRDGIGGPGRGRTDYFSVIGEADLGDEGRLPPHLTRVGDKLRPEWLRDVLVNRGTARPYMATRMPQFGEANVGPLAGAFEKSDSPAAPETAVNAADAKFGRKLIGVGGLVCISCHTFDAHKSLGIPAMDLTLMTRRLKKEWFHRYLLDPPSLRPGTRMPTFWPDGVSAQKEILGGDTPRQIDAVWAYLSRAKEVGLPPGLIQGKLELVADKEAVIYRAFIAGGGTRAIGVGYPEKANLVFDANDARLAMIWQGPFIDAAKHRSGRGDGFVPPLGYNVVTMPAGPPFAVLPEADAPWPTVAGKKDDYQMRGYALDDKQRPAFRYSYQGVQIEDDPIAVPGDNDAFFRRTLTLQGGRPLPNLWFRAWAGKVEANGDGSFLAEGKVKLRFRVDGTAKPVVRSSAGKSELLVPVTLTGRPVTIVEEIIW